jgi:hypothetical protein
VKRHLIIPRETQDGLVCAVCGGAIQFVRNKYPTPFWRHDPGNWRGVLSGPHVRPGRKYPPLVDRFRAKVDQRGPDECWPWLGLRVTARGQLTYGTIFGGGRHHWTNRLAWELANGPIPEGLLVLHHCDNRPCCNPAHLFLGTHTDNARDMVAKGRGVNPRPFPNGEANPNARLTAAQVARIRELAASGLRDPVIAGEFGIAPQTVGKIVLRRRWALIGEKPEAETAPLGLVS